jgi:tRNA A-37 threonylcarbamoyl transferase component Bud32
MMRTLASLKVDKNPTTPFTLALPDGSELLCTDMLRLLPGKRMVMRAEYGGNTVLAKLFFDARHLQKETAGYALLENRVLPNTGVKTPALLTHCRIEHGGICLYQFIGDAISLDTLWRESTWRQLAGLSKALLMDKLVTVLQQCYQQRVLQQDLHLGNFLLQGDQLFMLDPASCQSLANASQQEDNLALLLAQLPFADWQPTLQKIHAVFPDTHTGHLGQMARQHWQRRQQKYLQKIFRDCSDIADLSTGALRILANRSLLTEALVKRLQNPASLADGTALKNGNSAKVFLLDIGGKKLVAKQYINKDWLRKIRRAFRPSRAARSWYFAHAFAFAGIRVPMPVAWVEQKTGLFVTSAWFICEYDEGKDLLTSWHDREPTVEELSCVHSLFLSLQIIQTSHGDMKATNLLSDGARIALIDYDGTKEHRRPSSFQRALAQDKERFLQNWAGNPSLQQKLAGLLAT